MFHLEIDNIEEEKLTQTGTLNDITYNMPMFHLTVKLPKRKGV